MERQRISSGLSLDIGKDGLDDQALLAFRRIREGAIESDLSAGNPELLDAAAEALANSIVLQRALALPQSIFDKKVASSGAQACSAVGDPSAVTPAHLN